MQVKNGIIIDGVLHELRESSGRDYVQCAKFDKDIVFTNKQAKL